jgi:hypothetical protein
MQQRQPRLGEIVDDYCPRERRITNHAVVAMVGDEVKQTRCTTCEAEHEYKQARVPPQRRKKEAGGGVLYQQVLAGMPRKVNPAAPSELDEFPENSAPDPEPLAAAGDDQESDVPVVAEEGERDLEVAVHRPLIRATLPRLTDEPPQRREPEFTIRSPQLTRPGKFGRNGFRGHRPGGQGQGFGATGNRAGGGQKRHGHGGQGNRQGGGGRPGQMPNGNRAPRPHGHGRGGKKSPR